MHSGFLRKVIHNLDLKAITLSNADLRAWDLTVVAPGRSVRMWLGNKPCPSRCGPE
mgnify:CR=1 FL=1